MRDGSVHGTVSDSETVFQTHQSLLASLERCSVYSDEISSFLPCVGAFLNTPWSFKPAIERI